LELKDLHLVEGALGIFVSEVVDPCRRPLNVVENIEGEMMPVLQPSNCKGPDNPVSLWLIPGG